MKHPTNQNARKAARYVMWCKEASLTLVTWFYNVLETLLWHFRFKSRRARIGHSLVLHTARIHLTISCSSDASRFGGEFPPNCPPSLQLNTERHLKNMALNAQLRWCHGSNVLPSLTWQKLTHLINAWEVNATVLMSSSKLSVTFTEYISKDNGSCVAAKTTKAKEIN